MTADAAERDATVVAPVAAPDAAALAATGAPALVVPIRGAFPGDDNQAEPNNGTAAPMFGIAAGKRRRFSLFQRP
jgi:hypothetical protein